MVQDSPGNEVWEYNQEAELGVKDRLVRKMASLVGSFCCIICRKAEEDLDHLFGGCQFARSVWISFLQEFNVQIVGQMNVQQRLGSFSSIHLSMRKVVLCAFLGCA